MSSAHNVGWPVPTTACKIAGTLLLAGALLAPHGHAQNPDTLMPEASATKAKQILARMLEALGGAAYMNAHESECSGRFSQFGHNNDLTSYMEFKDYWRFPDNHRIDYGKKGNIIDSYSGDDGWTLDHDGVSEQTYAQLQAFQEQLRKDPHYLFRRRLKEPGMMFRYGGEDLIDLRPVDWVELTDRKEWTYRVAVQRENHLMVRFVVILPDPENHDRIEEVTSYANYHPLDGVETPLQVMRTRNGRKILQAFYNTCKYNPNLPADFFNKTALEQRFREVGSRSDKKKAAQAKD
jgi:hypothetical protein